MLPQLPPLMPAFPAHLLPTFPTSILPGIMPIVNNDASSSTNTNTNVAVPKDVGILDMPKNVMPADLGYGPIFESPIQREGSTSLSVGRSRPTSMSRSMKFTQIQHFF